MRCKCGKWTPWARRGFARDDDGHFHTPRGCGFELVWEGATCRGAAGRWEAHCHTENVTLSAASPVISAVMVRLCMREDHARELTFTEAES